MDAKVIMVEDLVELSKILLDNPDLKIIGPEDVSNLKSITVPSNLANPYDFQEMYIKYLRKIPSTLYSEEKKNKKPCTFHEYTEIRQEAGDNFIISKWKCRHCGHPLN